MRKARFENSLEATAIMLTRDTGIYVRFSGSTAYTDGKLINLPILVDAPDELEQDLNGFLDHEVAHCLFTQFDQMALCRNKFEQMLTNRIEDIRIEKLMGEKFKGSRIHLEDLNNKWRNTKEMEYYNSSIATIPEKLGIAFQRAFRKEPLSYNQIREFKKLYDAGWEHIEPVLDAKDTTTLREASAKATDAILKLYKELLDEAKKTNGKVDPSGEGDDGESGDGSNGTSSDKSKSKSKSKDKNDNSVENSQEQAQKNIEMMEADLNSGDNPLDHVPGAEEYIRQELEKYLKEEEKQVRKLQKNPMTDKDISPRISLPYSTEFDIVKDFSNEPANSTFYKEKVEISPFINPIKNRLERMLKVKENARWSFDREYGQLNKKSLAKFITDANYNTPFKEKTLIDTKNVAVTLLVDSSGSMWESNKIKLARQTAMALGESLSGLGISFEVLGFRTKESGQLWNLTKDLSKQELKRYNRTSEILEHTVYKHFNSTSLNGISHLTSGGCNVDGESLLWAVKRLTQRREKKKIMIVLSDGRPSASGSNDYILAGDLKRVVESIEKSDISLIGFSIGTDCSKLFYKNWVLVSTIDQLPGSVLNKVSEVLLKEQ